MSRLKAESLVNWDGALLIHKPRGVTSYDVVDRLVHILKDASGLKKRDLPKIGHGGTLDPFATGLLPVCVGRAVKLSRYFLESTKEYRGVIRFGVTTTPGDPTDPISERSEHLPESLEAVTRVAHSLTLQPYLQIPPMHSAKKVDGVPLYEMARQGIEIEREPVLRQLYEFEILDYRALGDGTSSARFRVVCSSGTYVRVLAQDLGRILGSVAMLDELSRTRVMGFYLGDAIPLEQLDLPWDQSPAWIPFDQMLDRFPGAAISEDEHLALTQGRQSTLLSILPRARAGEQGFKDSVVVLKCRERLSAVARRGDTGGWTLERVFTRDRPETLRSDFH